MRRFVIAEFCASYSRQRLSPALSRLILGTASRAKHDDGNVIYNTTAEGGLGLGKQGGVSPASSQTSSNQVHAFSVTTLNFEIDQT